MTNVQKKEFLSNDLIERMIRVEQRVSLSFGESVKYDKTQAFQALTPAKKKEFISYLRHIKARRAMGYSFLLFLGFSFLFLSITPITGNAIFQGTSLESFSGIFLFLFILLIFLFLFYTKIKKERHKRLEGVYHLVDSSLKKKIHK